MCNYACNPAEIEGLVKTEQAFAEELESADDDGIGEPILPIGFLSEVASLNVSFFIPKKLANRQSEAIERRK